jgi:large-conductance mechanosensitive channel
LAVCLGKNALSEMFTFLVRATKLDETGAEVVDLANSIYIDWGSFINAVINFLLTAIVLFCIVKIINGVKEKDKKFKESMQPVISKEDRIEMKKRGIKSKDTAAIKAYFDEKAAKEEAEKAAAAEKARLDREANPTTEDLLKKILAVLEKN